MEYDESERFSEGESFEEGTLYGDGARCDFHRPGVLAELEDEANANRDAAFEQEFFFCC